MNLLDFFTTAVRQFPNRLAIEMRPRYRTVRWTYAMLGAQVAALAARLEREGVMPGDRVLLYGINSPHWMAGFFAILARGAVVVPLNPQSTPKQLDGIVASSEPRMLLKSRRIPWLAAPIQTLDIQSVTEDPEPMHLSMESLRVPPIEAGALAEIVYTSGTTGAPKGVMLTHANLLANLAALSQVVPLAETDHIISIIPLFHMYGQMTSMLYPMKFGAAVTFVPSLGSKMILETFRYTRATHLAAVPEFLKTIMQRLDGRLAEHGLSPILHSTLLERMPLGVRRFLGAPIRARISKSLMKIASGGAPLDPEVERMWRRLGYEVYQGYGLTETSPLLTTNRPNDFKVGTVGKPVPGVETRISTDGELQVRGPNVMKGYYRDAERTAAAFDGEWFKTDDGAKVDADGFISIFGRRKYMIVGDGGEKVFPEDIEEVLNHLPGVKDSAVVGVKKNNRMVISAVLLADDVKIDEVIEEANAHLASHQQILLGVRWPEADFPRSATQKIKKEEVMRWLLQQDEPASAKKEQTGTITPFMRILAQVTKRNPREILPETKLVTDLHLDSLLRIELVSQVEEELGVELEEKAITGKTTVEEVERMLASQAGKAPTLVKYPRWSNRAVFQKMRPLLQSALLFWWLRPFVKLRIEGQEHLAQLEGPVIFMPNHRSYVDPSLLLQALPVTIRRKLGIAAGVDVLYTKFSWVAWLADLVFNSYPFPTEVYENIRPGLEYTGRLLDDGCSILIFPEGQVLRSGAQMNHLKAGAGVIACEMQATVVPMVVLGIEKLMKPGQIIPRRRGPVTVRIGEPLHFSYTEDYGQATERIEQAMKKLIEK